METGLDSEDTGGETGETGTVSDNDSDGYDDAGVTAQYSTTCSHLSIFYGPGL